MAVCSDSTTSECQSMVHSRIGSWQRFPLGPAHLNTLHLVDDADNGVVYRNERFGQGLGRFPAADDEDQFARPGLSCSIGGDYRFADRL